MMIHFLKLYSSHCFAKIIVVSWLCFDFNYLYCCFDKGYLITALVASCTMTYLTLFNGELNLSRKMHLVPCLNLFVF